MLHEFGERERERVFVFWAATKIFMCFPIWFVDIAGRTVLIKNVTDPEICSSSKFEEKRANKR